MKLTEIDVWESFDEYDFQFFAELHAINRIKHALPDLPDDVCEQMGKKVAEYHKHIIDFNYEKFKICLSPIDIEMTNENELEHIVMDRLKAELYKTFDKIFAKELFVCENKQEIDEYLNSGDYISIGNFNGKTYILHICLYKIADTLPFYNGVLS